MIPGRDCATDIRQLSYDLDLAPKDDAHIDRTIHHAKFKMK